MAATPAAGSRAASALLFTPGDRARSTVFITLMNACTLFGWWGLNSWVPAYLEPRPTSAAASASRRRRCRCS